METSKAIFIVPASHPLPFTDHPNLQFDTFETYSQHAFVIIQSVLHISMEQIDTGEFFKTFPHDSRVRVYVLRYLPDHVEYWENFQVSSPEFTISSTVCGKCAPPVYTYFVSFPRDTEEGLETRVPLELLRLGETPQDLVPAVDVLKGPEALNGPVFAFQTKESRFQSVVTL